MRVGNKLLAQDASFGALPTLFAASQELPPGSYVGPDSWFEFRGHPKVVGRSTAAANADLATALWTKSEELTDVRFPANA
ncbi:hypothetical protein ACQP2U_06360 [Nocardia sp. CA-084685]